MPRPHAIRLLGPWLCQGVGTAAPFRAPGLAPAGGAATFVRRFQWVAELPPDERLSLAAPPLPAAAAWSLNGQPLGAVPAGAPASFPLPRPLPRANELRIAFEDWPAAAVFPGAALVAQGTAGGTA